MATARIVSAPNVRPVFQVAVGDADAATGNAVYDTARYNDATPPTASYSGLDAQWTDDSCDVVEATLYYGRQRSVDVFDIGTAVLRVANPDGLWDYPPTGDTGTPLVLRPGRQLHVGVVIDHRPVVYLWHGWIDAVQPGYDPTEGDYVTVNAVCAKGEVGRADAARLETAVGGGENVANRMDRYADVVTFPAHRRQFDPTGVQLAGTTMGTRLGSLMDRSARSGGGDLFGDQHGFLTYRSKDWQARGPGVAPDGYIGNRDLPGEVCPNQWEILFQRSDFTTRVNYGQAGGSVSVIDDAANMLAYGVETFTMTDLETVDPETLETLARRVLRVRSFDNAPRIAAVHLDAAQPGAADLMAAADPFGPSYYGCGLVAKDGRAVFARAMYCTGIEHTITAGSWTARLALDDAAPWATNADTRYDAAHYGTDRYAKAV